jgi:adenine deaminase
MNDMKKREMLSEVALGNIPADIVLNGTLFNACTGEFIPGQSIWIKGDRIAYVGPDHDPCRDERTVVIDAEDRVLLPGLIDAHTHLSKYGLEEWIRHLIPRGVTTLVAETIELVLFTGKRGLDYFARGLEGQPIRLYYTLPSLGGLTASDEIMAPKNEELLPFFRDPRCLGVGEIFWGNILLKGEKSSRVRGLTSLALELGKRVEGHGAGARGRKLQAYTCFGIFSDHEPINEDEVLERLRLGYWVMVREGSVRRELDGVKEIFRRKIDFRRMVLTTDSVDAGEFLAEGHLDGAVRRALKFGIPPALVYQMVTLNAAEHFRIDHVIGSLSPGTAADILIIPSPAEFSPQLVMCNGRIIFQDGKTLAQPNTFFFPEDMFHMVNVEGYTFPPLPNKGKVRVMELVTRLVTQEKIIDLEDPKESEDVIKIFALDRVGGGGAFMGFLKGFGLQRGAYGSTMMWDTIDMAVAGCDTRSMKTVMERLKELGGGAVYAIGEEIVAEFAAPFCGMISLKSMEAVRDENRKLEDCLMNNGVPWEKPALTFDTLTTPAIPHMRISHEGYVRLKDREILPVEV